MLVKFSSGFRSILSNSKVFSIAKRNMSSSEDTVVSRCIQKISESLQPSELVVTSSNDDPNGSHIQIKCIADIFQGKNAVQRQKLVYKAIWDELETGRVHAVDSVIAKTPAEISK